MPPDEERLHWAMHQELAQKIKELNTKDNEMTKIAKILIERGKRYGKFVDHAMYSQALKQMWCDSPGYVRSTISQREAMDMIMHKIARIMNGDPNYADSWQDIAGYAQLVVDILEEQASDEEVSLQISKALDDI